MHFDPRRVYYRFPASKLAPSQKGVDFLVDSELLLDYPTKHHLVIISMSPFVKIKSFHVWSVTLANESRPMLFSINTRTQRGKGKGEGGIKKTPCSEGQVSNQETMVHEISRKLK